MNAVADYAKRTSSELVLFDGALLRQISVTHFFILHHLFIFLFCCCCCNCFFVVVF